MKYKIKKPKNAPDWFTPGISCTVEDRDGAMLLPRAIVWYNGDSNDLKFLDDSGEWWEEAKPMEQWKPKVGETVAVWRCASRQNVSMIEKITPILLIGKRYSPIPKAWYDAGCPMEVEWWEKQPNVYTP